jgi:mRNA interferase HigB
MRLVSVKVLQEFCRRHPAAAGGVRRWSRQMESLNIRNFNELHSFFGSADYVAPFTRFNISGNKFRLVVIINYSIQTVFVRWTMTHAEYDKWSKRYLQGKIKS